MSKIRRKPFAPRDGEPGARIEWEQYSYSGKVTRTGIVWSKAPGVNGCRVVWVTPDRPSPLDLYPAVPVMVQKGLNHSTYLRGPLRDLWQSAADHARKVRESKRERIAA